MDEMERGAHYKHDASDCSHPARGYITRFPAGRDATTWTVATRQRAESQEHSSQRASRGLPETVPGSMRVSALEYLQTVWCKLWAGPARKSASEGTCACSVCTHDCVFRTTCTASKHGLQYCLTATNSVLCHVKCGWQLVCRQLQASELGPMECEEVAVKVPLHGATHICHQRVCCLPIVHK